MRKEKCFGIIVGFVLAASLVVSLLGGACAPAAPTGEGDCSDVEADLAAEEKKTDALEDEVSDLEKEVAALKKPAEVIEWKCQNYFPGGPMYELTARCDDIIETASDGRLVVTSYPEAALVPTAEIASAVGAGTVEMGMTCGGYHMGTIPIAAFEGAQPMFLPAAELDYFLYDYGGIDIIRRGYAAENIYWVANYDDTQALLMTVDKPIWSVDDLKGLKFRSYGAASRMWDGLGAATKWVPGGELYLGLATGVFDGAHYGGAWFEYELGMHEICKYILVNLPAYYAGDGANLVNMDEWDALPDDLQTVIFLASLEIANSHRRESQAKNTLYLNKMVVEWGVTKTFVPEEDIALAQEVATDVWAYYGAADEYCEEFYELMVDFMEEMGRLE